MRCAVCGRPRGERLARPTPTLEQALETFVAIYQPLFGVVQPNSRAATGVLAAFLRRSGFDPRRCCPSCCRASRRRRRSARAAHGRSPTAVDPEAARRRAGRSYLDEFGDEAPRWDVAAPTWRERSSSLERLMRNTNVGAPIDDHSWREAADAVRARLPDDGHAEWESRLSVARRAAAVAEDDDALYARLQAHVRRALLREGERLWQSGVLADPNEVFWLPIEAVRKDARGEAPLGFEEAALALAAARSADAEARTNPPPLGAADTLDVGTDVVRGRPGSAGARIGPVRIYRGDHDHDHDGEHVLVARTLLPTELPLLSPAAIVVETGGVLDHVAAQARERAIPAVVGAVGACRACATAIRSSSTAARASSSGSLEVRERARVHQVGELAITANRAALDEDDGDRPPVRALDQLRARPAIAGDVDGLERNRVAAEQLFRAAAPAAGLRTEHGDWRARCGRVLHLLLLHRYQMPLSALRFRCRRTGTRGSPRPAPCRRPVGGERVGSPAVSRRPADPRASSPRASSVEVRPGRW